MEVIVGQLVVRLENDIVQKVPITAGGLKLGRLPENGVVLAHPLVSRFHAEVRWGGPSGLTVTDLESTHGTYVGDQRLISNQPHIVPPGSSFSIGPFVITYEAESLPLDVGTAASAQQHIEEQIAEAASMFKEAYREAPPPGPLSVVSGDGSLFPVAMLPRLPRPLPPASGPQSAYLNFLPVPFQELDFMGRFLLIFESLWEPLEHRQDAIHMYFDPKTCPTSFLPWLASWLDLSLNEHWPEFRRRQLLSEAITLYRWRGTRYGLIRMIELCTGVTPEIRESEKQPYVFSIRLHIPSDLTVDAAFVEDIIKAHKPAHAGYILEIV